MKNENQFLLWIDKLKIGLYLQTKSQQKPKPGQIQNKEK